jgi:HSP20 family protein
VYRSERSYGQFRRQIPLPEGAKLDTATASFKNGVLEVTVEAPHPTKNRRRIQVQGGEESGQKPGQSAA